MINRILYWHFDPVEQPADAFLSIENSYTNGYKMEMETIETKGYYSGGRKILRKT